MQESRLGPAKLAEVVRAGRLRVIRRIGNAPRCACKRHLEELRPRFLLAAAVLLELLACSPV